MFMPWRDEPSLASRAGIRERQVNGSGAITVMGIPNSRSALEDLGPRAAIFTDAEGREKLLAVIMFGDVFDKRADPDPGGEDDQIECAAQ